MRPLRLFLLFISFHIFFSLNSCSQSATNNKEKKFTSEKRNFTVVEIADNLKFPWGMAFISENEILITERNGTVKLFANQKMYELEGLSIDVAAKGQGGILDIALHPKYKENGFVYMTYSKQQTDKLSATTLVRFKLKGRKVYDFEEIFVATPWQEGRLHFGSRITFDNEGYLYISLGDRYTYPGASNITRPEKASPQDLSMHMGSIIRLKDDGSIPADNPFVNTKGAKPEIYSYGHRNPQGLTFNIKNNTLYSHEHGAKGGDELNIIKRGENYGWPVITYGVDYSGGKIGIGTHKEGMLQPIYHWDPSIAPSGMVFCFSSKYPEWENNLFIGVLKFGLLVRLEIENHKVIHEERLLDNHFGRIRDVKMSPQGYLYVLTDSFDGKMLKIK